MCQFPFSISRVGRRSPGFFKCDEKLHARLAEDLQSAPKHEFHYLNASGAWCGLLNTAKQKSLSNGEALGLQNARYLGLSWSFAAVGDQDQLARYDYYTQVVESGGAVA